jgi:hypothetical protein
MTTEELATAARRLLQDRGIRCEVVVVPQDDEIVIMLGDHINDDLLLLQLHQLDTDKLANPWTAPARIAPCRICYFN